MGWLAVLAVVALLSGAGAARAASKPPPLTRIVLPNGLVFVRTAEQSSRVALCLVLRTGVEVEAKLEPRLGRALLDTAGGMPAELVERGGRRHAAVTPDRLEHCVEVAPDDALAATRWLSTWFTRRTPLAGSPPASAEPSSDQLGVRKLRGLALRDPEPPAVTPTVPDAEWSRYREAALSGSRAVAVLTGQPSEELVAQLVAALSRAPRGAPAPTRTSPPPRQTSERFMTVRDDRLPAPLVFYGWAVPGAGEPAHRALQLIGLALAGGAEGTLVRVLVETRQVAKTVSVGLDDQGSSNLFWLRFGVTPGLQVDRLAAPLTEIMRRVRLLGLTERELDYARQVAQAWFEWVLADPGALALALARVELRTGQASDWFSEHEALMQVTRAETRDAAAALHEQRQSIVELHPRYYIDQPSAPDQATKKPSQRVHKVRRGDTLGQIAQRYGVSLEALLRENKLQRRSLISPGQKLLVPAPPPPRSGSKR